METYSLYIIYINVMFKMYSSCLVVLALF